MGLQIFFNSFKALSVDGAAAEFPDRCLMGFGRVSFVFGKTELGVVLVVPFHEPVTGYFCNDRCSGNGNAAGVTFGNSFLGQG